MGQEEAFGRYVMESYTGLVRRGVLLVGNRHSAEDLVQVALAKAYGRWGRIHEPDAYLRTVMVRTSMAWRARRWNGEVPTGHLPEARCGDGTDAADLSATVRRALMALGPEQRAVIVLRYFDDCSELEIAEILGCSPGTVKSRAARALAALRDNRFLAEEGLLR